MVNVGGDTDYHVVHLFENTNETWYRTVANTGIYEYNVTSTDNFVRVPQVYNFGNFTESFMNSSAVYPSVVNDGFGNFNLNITYFAGWNNSAQNYVSHIFNFTWSNDTLLGPCPNRVETVTCMESAWIASDFNVTWNGTDISKNWTI